MSERPPRIAATSDLHYDSTCQLTPPKTIAAMVEKIRREEPDIVVIAGDVAHGLDEFRRCLDLFKGLDSPVAALAGNHDVWRDREGGHSSHDLWHRLLPQAVRDAGAIWLEDEIISLGDAALVGSMLWYDYSAVDAGGDLPASEISAMKGLLNNDAHWIDWTYGDQEMADRLGDGLRRRLDAASADRGIGRIVVATHVPVLEQQMTRKPDDERWGLSNAYFGNLTTGRMVMQLPKVRAILSGHTHVGRQGTARRKGMPPVDYTVIPSEYGRPEYVVITLPQSEDTVGEG